MHESPSIHDVVLHALHEMGIPAPSSLVRTLALREGRLVAEKFHFGSGYAVWLAGSQVVDFYDPEGTLWKRLALDTADKQRAAPGPRQADKAA